MRATFLTTHTNDLDKIIGAWNCWNDTPAGHVKFDYRYSHDCSKLVNQISATEPDVIFYIGAFKGDGNPSYSTLREIKAIAPLINICCDAADDPWWPELERMRTEGCFSKTVAIDGNKRAPVDLVTLTPIDFSRFYQRIPEKDIILGFAGGWGRASKRERVLNNLGAAVERQRRTPDRRYGEYIDFLYRCSSVVNTPWTGTGNYMHVKGRVMEAPLCGAAVFEYADSPAFEWFGDGSLIAYRSERDIAKVLMSEDFFERAELASQRMKDKITMLYHPKMIFEAIMKGVI